MAALAQFQSIDEGNGWENELALVIGDDGGVISTAQSAVVINLLRNANKVSLRSAASDDARFFVEWSGVYATLAVP